VNSKSICDAEGGEIGADAGDGGARVLDEMDVGCAAAEGLDGDGAGAGVEVGEDGAGDARGEDVEEGLAETVAGGTRLEAAGSGERTGAVVAGDDAHQQDCMRGRSYNEPEGSVT